MVTRDDVISTLQGVRDPELGGNIVELGMVTDVDVIGASVLSGNRNFEARVHQSIKANFLMSPPLVVAFALAGRIDVDMTSEPLGTGKDGQDIYLRDIWPSMRSTSRSLIGDGGLRMPCPPTKSHNILTKYQRTAQS